MILYIIKNICAQFQLDNIFFRVSVVVFHSTLELKCQFLLFLFQILRPIPTSFFRIYKEGFQEVYQLDASSSFDYQFMSKNKIRIKTSIKFEEKQSYFITLDDGFVIGTTQCGVESKYIRDNNFWKFTISK